MFKVPSYRYDGNVPKGASIIIDVRMPETVSAMSNGAIRCIQKKGNIVEITTTDPNARFLFWWNHLLQVDLVIAVPPGTYRFLSSLLTCYFSISHSAYPDYNVVYYKTPMTRKLQDVKVYTSILGKEYYYYHGDLCETKSKPTSTDVKIPRQIPAPDTERRKCCPTCKQSLPDREKLQREGKNRKRRPENYPSYFRRKIDSIVSTGLITEIPETQNPVVQVKDGAKIEDLSIVKSSIEDFE